MLAAGRDLFEFSLLLERLYQPVSLEAFPDHLIETIAEWYPEAVLTFHEVDVASGALKDWSNCRDADREMCTEVQAQFLHEHPVVTYAAAGGPELVLAATDFVTQREFRRTNFYNLVLRPFGLEHQLVARLPGANQARMFTMNRDRIFREEDRALSAMLLPHIVQARERARLLDQSRAGRLRLSVAGFEALLREGLTRRECEVLLWLVEGKRDREIAIILGISPRTVSNHVARILQKLGVETRTAAAARVLECLG